MVCQYQSKQKIQVKQEDMSKTLKIWPRGQRSTSYRDHSSSHYSRLMCCQIWWANVKAKQELSREYLRIMLKFTVLLNMKCRCNTIFLNIVNILYIIQVKRNLFIRLNYSLFKVYDILDLYVQTDISFLNKRPTGLNGHLSITDFTLTSCWRGSYLYINSPIIE